MASEALLVWEHEIVVFRRVSCGCARQRSVNFVYVCPLFFGLKCPLVDVLASACEVRDGHRERGPLETTIDGRYKQKRASVWS